MSFTLGDLRFQREKNLLHKVIEEAKFNQKERHHNELLSFNYQKLNNEQNIAKDKLAFEKEKNLQALQLQEIQMQNNLELQDRQHQGQLDLAILNNFHQIHQSENMQLNSVLGKLLENKIAEKQNQRDVQLKAIEARIETIKMKLAHKQQMEKLEKEHQYDIEKIKLLHKQEAENKKLQHNLLVVEKYVDSHLVNTELEFDKFVTIVYRLVERAVGLEVTINDSDIQAYVDEAMGQMQA